LIELKLGEVDKRSFVDRISKSRKGKVEEPCKETIPMAYPDYFLDARNITNNLTMNSSTNNSSSNNVNLWKNKQEKKEWFKPPTEAEPIVINQVKKRKVKKKRRCETKFNSYPIRTKKKYNQEKSTHSINQYNLSQVFNTNSNQVAQPIEVLSTGVMSSIIRGETILMAWHCFISLSRNLLSNLSNKSSKQLKLKQSIKNGFESEEEYHKSKEVLLRIFWRKLFI
jgi:hypothetical protein